MAELRLNHHDYLHTRWRFISMMNISLSADILLFLCSINSPPVPRSHDSTVDNTEVGTRQKCQQDRGVDKTEVSTRQGQSLYIAMYCNTRVCAQIFTYKSPFGSTVYEAVSLSYGVHGSLMNNTEFVFGRL